MRVTDTEYAAMPRDLQRMFDKVPNPGSDEVLAVFPESTSGANPTRRGAPKFRNTYGEFEGQADCAPARGAEAGSAARFFYCAKATTAERDEGMWDSEYVRRSDGRASDIENPRLRTSPRKNFHPTVKPVALMRWLVRLITPPGGIVLDPFMGSGTTLIAARAEGHKSIGVDLEAAHCEIARGRMSQGVLL